MQALLILSQSFPLLLYTYTDLCCVSRWSPIQVQIVSVVIHYSADHQHHRVQVVLDVQVRQRIPLLRAYTRRAQKHEGALQPRGHHGTSIAASIRSSSTDRRTVHAHVTCEDDATFEPGIQWKSHLGRHDR